MKTASQNQLYMKMLNFFNAADTGGIHFNLPPTQRRAEFISISHQRRGGRNSFQSRRRRDEPLRLLVIFSLMFFVFSCVHILGAQTVIDLGDGAQENFIKGDWNRASTPALLQKVEDLLSDPLVLSASPVSVDSISKYIEGKTLAFQNPLTGEEYNFEVNSVIDHGNGKYFWLGYSKDGGVFSMSSTIYGKKGIIDLPDRDVIYEIVTLDSLEYYFIEKQSPENVNGDTSAYLGEECGTDHNEPLNEIYDDNYLEERCYHANVSILFLSTPGVWGVANPRQIARTTIDELNSAATASGVERLYVSAGVDDLLNFAQRPSVPGRLGGDLAADDLADIKANMDYQNKRNFHNADLTVILVPTAYNGFDLAGNPTNIVFGRAAALAADKDHALCVVAAGAANSRFTAVHEIAHLLGARHERPENNCGGGDSQTHFHGFILPDTRIQTILTSRDCGFTRIARFSEKGGEFNGVITGNGRNKNATIISRCSKRAACFEETDVVTGFNPVDLTRGYVGILGPSIVDDCSTNDEWTAIVGELFQNPINYIWEFSETGIGNWQWLGNEHILTKNSMPIMPESFILRLRASDGQGNWGYATKIIGTAYCIGNTGGGSFLSTDNNDISEESASFQKNIANFHLSNQKEISNIIVYDISGKEILRFSNKMLIASQLKNLTNKGLFFIFTQYKDGSYDVQKMVNIL